MSRHLSVVLPRGGEEVVQGAHHDARAVLRPHHRVRLPATRRPVREHCRVVALATVKVNIFEWITKIILSNGLFLAAKAAQ